MLSSPRDRFESGLRMRCEVRTSPCSINLCQKSGRHRKGWGVETDADRLQDYTVLGGVPIGNRKISSARKGWIELI